MAMLSKSSSCRVQELEFWRGLTVALLQQVRQELLAESRKCQVARWLRQIPCIGPIRSALLLALIQTPHRFRTKRQLWGLQHLVS